MYPVCPVFSTAVVMHDDRTVPRSAFGPPQDDIAVRVGMTNSPWTVIDRSILVADSCRLALERDDLLQALLFLFAAGKIRVAGRSRIVIVLRSIA